MTLTLTTTLTATDDPRVKTGLLLPYGEYGHTSHGKVTAAKGALSLADHLDQLTLEHSPKLGVADFITFDEEDDGLHCSVRYLDTPLGNAALAEFDAGTRTGLSVEVDNPLIRSGRLQGGKITGGSQVETPAFPTAKLAAADVPVAPDMGDGPPTEELPAVVIDGAELPNVETVTVTPQEIDITTTSAPVEAATPEGTPTMTAATVAQVTNSALVAVPPKPIDKNALFAAFAEAGRTRMTAALSDIVPADILGQSDTQPQYVGELWDGKAYQRKIVPLFSHATLTSFKIAGWRWVTKPEVGLYAGNKAPIPSNAVETEPTESEAQRIAGGHDIDRKYRDFSNAEFWESYFAAMTESYARVSDKYVYDEVVAEATPVTSGTVPSGVAPGLVKIVDGALAILNATDTVPDWALVATDLWRAMLFTRSDDALAYLNAAIGLEDGSTGTFMIQPSAAVAAGKVLVGCRAAATVHELPGSPIRVEAIDLARAGIDEALFGYIGVNVHDAEGLALVS